MENIDINGLYTDSLEGVLHDLGIHHERRMSRTRQDSGRSGTYLKNDSGFLTNSSDIMVRKGFSLRTFCILLFCPLLLMNLQSRDDSPTRESLLRRARSRSPTMGKYVIDRNQTIRNHQIISTFEDLELEKLLLKDENTEMRDRVSIHKIDTVSYF